MGPATRALAAALVALLTPGSLAAQEEARLRVGGMLREELSPDDPELAGHGPSRTFELVAEVDGRLTVTLSSYDFDAFLVIEDEAGEFFEFEDDGGIETDARIVFPAEAGTRYRVVAAQTNGHEGGRFRLTVERGAPPELSEVELANARIAHLVGQADSLAARGEWEGEAALRLQIGEDCLRLSDYENAERELERARELYLRIGEAHDGEPDWEPFLNWREAECLRLLGGVAYATGRLDEALDHYTRAQELFAAVDDPGTRWKLALLDVNVGQVHGDGGQVVEAQTCFKRALAVFAEGGDVELQAWVLGLLGDLLLQQGRLKDAQERIEQLLALVRGLDEPDPRVIGNALARYGGLLLAQERWEKARETFEEWRDLAEQHDLLDHLPDAYANLALVYRALGRVETAREYGEKGRALAEQLGDRSGTVRSLMELTRSQLAWDVELAIRTAERALDLAREIGDGAGELDALSELANHHRYLAGQGDVPEGRDHAAIAREYCDRGLKRAAELGNRPAEALALHELGMVECAEGNLDRRCGETDAARGHYQEAVRLYDRAEGIYREVGDPAFYLRKDRACAYRDLGDRDTFFAELEALMEAPIPLELRRLVLDDLIRAWMVTDPLKALDASQEFLVLSHGRSAMSAAGALVHVGHTYWSLGRPQAALALYWRVLELQVPEVSPHARWGFGLVHSTFGDHERALAFFEQALDEGDDSPVLMANVAHAHWQLGELGSALEYGRHALALAEEMRSPQGRAWASVNLAAVHVELGQWSEARQLAESAVQLGERAGDGPVQQRLALWALARVALAEGDLAGAEGAVQAGEELTRLTQTQARAAGGWGSPLPHLDRYWERLMQDLVVARLAAAGEGERPALLADGFRRASSTKGRQLLGGIVEHRRGERSAAVIDQRRRLRRATREHQEALMRLTQALGDDERWRLASGLREEAERLQAQVESLRRTYDAMYRPDPGLPEGADPEKLREELLDDRTALVEYAEGENELYAYVLTRTDLELLSLGDREAIERRVDEFVGAVSRLGSCEQVVGPGRALFEQLLAPVLEVAGPEVERLLVVPSRELARLPFDALVVRSGQELALDGLERGQRALGRVLSPVLGVVGPDSLRFGAGQVWELALQPLAERLGDVPPTFDAVDFVLDRYEVVLGPSSPVLLELADRAQRAARRGGKVLLLADPVYPSEGAEPSGDESARTDAGPAFLQGRLALDLQELARLPKTREEALAIADRIVGPAEERAVLALQELRGRRSGSLRSQWLDLYLGREATPRQLERTLADYQVLHLAAHGFVERRVSDQAVQEAGIVLTAASEGDDGVLALNDVLELSLDADLVVLSACDSAKRGAGPGEGVGSMALAFLYAGARSTVASLWQVDDAAAAETMKGFYQALFVEGLAPAAALRAAKRALREERGTRGVAPLAGGSNGGGSAEAGHPFSWAPFVYLGLGE